MARRAGAAVVLLLLLSGCAYLRGGRGEEEIEAEPQIGIRYGVEIRGGVDDQIRNTLLSASDANQTISRRAMEGGTPRRGARDSRPLDGRRKVIE